MYLKFTEDYWALDIEANSLWPDKLWCIVVTNVVTGECHKFYNESLKDFRKFVESRPNAFWVGHNIISYDAIHIDRLLGVSLPPNRCIDSLVLSRLYHPKMPGGHSLEAYGERFKVPKDLFNDFSRWSEPLMARCVVDVGLTIKVFKALVSKMKAVGFSEKSCELEHQVRRILDKQQLRGFYFDLPKALELQARLNDKQDNLTNQIHALFPPSLVEVNTYDYKLRKDGTPTHHYNRHREQYAELRHHDNGTYSIYDYQAFNIGSPPQRLQKLLSLGFVPTKVTKGGNPSVDEESLVEFAKETNIPEVQSMAEWMVLQGRISMIGTWLDNLGPDQRIHGRVDSCGAASRRMTHSSPNTANVPGNEAAYGHDVRSLWVASPGLVLVGYDAKAAQMRCFAHFLPNPANGARFYTEGHDPHQENADQIGITRKKVKNVFYANMFGAFPPKLAATAGYVGSSKELNERGTWIQNELYRVTPGLKEATESARMEARSSNEGWMRCVDGGYVRCPSDHAALNYRIQPAEACLMKQATVFIDQRSREQGIEQYKVGDIHDESQHELSERESEAFGRLCVQAIRDAGEELNFRVPMDGDYKVGRSWAETH